MSSSLTQTFQTITDQLRSKEIISDEPIAPIRLAESISHYEPKADTSKVVGYPAYSSAQDYNVGAIAVYSGNAYECISAVTSSDWNPDYWQATSVYAQSLSTNSEVSKKLQSTAVAIAFSATSEYSIGDYVTYGGQLYVCISAHAAGEWSDADFQTASLLDSDASLVIDSATYSMYVKDGDAQTIWDSRLGALKSLSYDSSVAISANSVQYVSIGNETVTVQIPELVPGKSIEFALDIESVSNNAKITFDMTSYRFLSETEGAITGGMLSIAAGVRAHIEFKQTAFKVDGLPAFYVKRTDLFQGIST